MRAVIETGAEESEGFGEGLGGVDDGQVQSVRPPGRGRREKHLKAQPAQPGDFAGVKGDIASTTRDKVALQS